MTMAPSKEDHRKFKRQSAHSILGPRLNKIVQVTYRTGEGRKMRTDHFYVAGLNDLNVQLDETYWDYTLNTEMPTKKSVSVPLEMIHVVVDLDKTGLVLFPTKMSKLGKR